MEKVVKRDLSNVYKEVKDSLFECKIMNENIRNAKYHHNAKFFQGPSIIKSGILSLDEAFYAGLFFNSKNTANFLYNSKITTPWLTMTPLYIFPAVGGSSPFIGRIDNSGKIDNPTTATHSGSVRPVINLKSTLKFTGDGTKSNPYVPSL